jgi:hypothetical protein
MRKFRMVKMIFFAAFAATLLTTVVMWLWNGLVPALFHGPALTWLQALGLLVLSKILFGGWRGGHRHGHWRGRMTDKWNAMSPEERDRFRQKWGHRCGPFTGGREATSNAAE